MWGIVTELVGKDPLHHPRHNHLSVLLTPGPLCAGEGRRQGNRGSGRWEISRSVQMSGVMRGQKCKGEMNSGELRLFAGELIC